MDEMVAACRSGNIASIEEMLSSEVVVSDLQKGLCEAIEAEQIPIIRMLMQHGVTIDELSFRAAIRAGSIDIYNCFLENGWEINNLEHGKTALRYVHGNHHRETER